MRHDHLLRGLALAGAFALTLTHALTGSGGAPLFTPPVVTLLVTWVLYAAARDASDTTGGAFALVLGLYVAGAALTAVVHAAAEGLLGSGGNAPTYALWPYDLLHALAALMYA